MNTCPQLRSGVRKAIDTIPIPTSIPAALDVHLQHFQEIASYNWVDERTATILVPGTILYLQTLTNM